MSAGRPVLPGVSQGRGRRGRSGHQPVQATRPGRASSPTSRSASRRGRSRPRGPPPRARDPRLPSVTCPRGDLRARPKVSARLGARPTPATSAATAIIFHAPRPGTAGSRARPAARADGEAAGGVLRRRRVAGDTAGMLPTPQTASSSATASEPCWLANAARAISMAPMPRPNSATRHQDADAVTPQRRRAGRLWRCWRAATRARAAWRRMRWRRRRGRAQATTAACIDQAPIAPTISSGPLM